MIQLYWCPQTRASRALWLLEELGEPFERITIDVRDEAAKADPAFRVASPMGKVPALADGEVALAESAAIAIYLADRYAPGRLAPALDAAERGTWLYWMIYTPAVIEPAMGEKFSGTQPNRGRNGWGDWPTMLATLEQRLAGREWILGDWFTAADVMVGSSVVFMRIFKMLPELPVLEAYADRCLAREAYQRALAADQEALAARS